MASGSDVYLIIFAVSHMFQLRTRCSSIFETNICQSM